MRTIIDWPRQGSLPDYYYSDGYELAKFKGFFERAHYIFLSQTW